MYSCITPYFVQKVVQPDLLCASLETQWCRDGATARVASRWCSAACCSSPRKSSRSCHRRLHGIGLTRSLEPRRVVHHQPGGLELGGGLGQLELDGLKLPDRLAELLPLLGVLERRREGTARHADHLRPDSDPTGIERLDRHLVADA